jgi:serine O-acetyltransferase
MQSRLAGISEKILTSYETVGGLNTTNCHNLPSKRAVDSLCEQLLQVLFPGFHDEGPIHKNELGEMTRVRLEALAERLGAQIGRSIRLNQAESPDERASEILHRFLDQIPDIRELLRTDIQAAFEGDPAATSDEEIILSYPCLEAIAIQRTAHLLYNEGIQLLPRMMTEWAHSRTGIDIHPGAKIGPYFFIDHGTGVVIGETCVIGHHVKLYHGVTLGARSFAKDERGQIVKGGKRHPKVGDFVTIYPNSTILGGETLIGEGSTIGANVFLMHSVPASSLVVYEEKQLRILEKSKPTTELEWCI